MKDLVKLSETEASYIKEGQELDDGITTKAGKLIMKKWTHLTIQPTSLSAWPALIEQTARPSIFIHQINTQRHFLMSTSVGGTVRTFDSLNLKTSTQLNKQLDALYGIEKERKSMKVRHKQKGTTDCGLFAIAYATEIAEGTDFDALCRMKFNQNEMRSHLLECFEKQEIARFPRVEGCEKK